MVDLPLNLLLESSPSVPGGSRTSHRMVLHRLGLLKRGKRSIKEGPAEEQGVDTGAQRPRVHDASSGGRPFHLLLKPEQFGLVTLSGCAYGSPASLFRPRGSFGFPLMGCSSE